MVLTITGRRPYIAVCRAKRRGVGSADTGTRAALASFAGAAACLWAAAFSAESFQWPEVVYDGERRNPGWLEHAYDRMKQQIVCVEGRYYDLKQAETRPELAVGVCISGTITVARLLAANAAFVRVDDGPTLYLKETPAAQRANDAKWEGTLLVVGTHRYNAGTRRHKRWRVVFACQLAPERPAAITRAQFVEAIRSGLQLHFWAQCPKCLGRGHVFKKDWRAPYPGAMHKESVDVKQPCPQCEGKGPVPVKEIKKPPPEPSPRPTTATHP